MGTNFYDDVTGEHIGKRSAAGLYCWDCKTTLCKGGEADVHHDRSGWHTTCPKCGRAPGEDRSQAAFVELGFRQPLEAEERHGVSSCSSFSWDIEPGKVEGIKDIKDEYGHDYTIQRFISEVLSNCPIRFTDSIGRGFS